MTRLILVSGLLGTLLVGACDGNHGTYAPKGKIAGWDKGEGAQLLAVVYDSSKMVELGSAAIAADGSFAMPEITAPAPELLSDSMSQSYPESCTTKPTYEPVAFKSTGIDLLVREPSGVTSGVKPDDSRGYLQIVYSDRAVSATGKLVCSQGNINAQLELHFVAGVNGILFKNSDPQTHESWMGTVPLPATLTLIDASR
jgi:hypothetical protein